MPRDAFRPVAQPGLTEAVALTFALVGLLTPGLVSAQDTATVLTRQTVELKATPDSVGRIVARLPTRTSLQQVPGRFGPWIQVRTTQGVTGWVQAMEVSGARVLQMPSLPAEATATASTVTPATPSPAVAETLPRKLSVTTPMAANAVAALPAAALPTSNASAPEVAGAASSKTPVLSIGAQRLLQAETFRADSESARKFAFQASLALNKLPQALYKGTLLDPATETPLPANGSTAFGNEGAKGLLEGVDLHPDVGLQTYVNQLGRWLSLESPYPDVPWTFTVVDGVLPHTKESADTRVSAWPSGHVFVSHRLVQKLNTEAELAGLLALGIAQSVQARRHASPNTTLALSTTAEDHTAVVLLARTGFNPAALVDALRLTTANGAGLTFMSALLGHDAPTQARIAGLRQFMGTRFEDDRKRASPSLSQRLASLAATPAQ